MKKSSHAYSERRIFRFKKFVLNEWLKRVKLQRDKKLYAIATWKFYCRLLIEKPFKRW